MKYIKTKVDGKYLWLGEEGTTFSGFIVHSVTTGGFECYDTSLDSGNNVVLFHVEHMECPKCGEERYVLHHESEPSYILDGITSMREKWFYEGKGIFSTNRKKIK